MDEYVGLQGDIDVVGNAGPLVVSQSASTRVYPSQIDVPLPDHHEMVFFKVWTQHKSSVLLCVCYRPQ